MEQRREKPYPDKQRNPGEQRNSGERPFGQGARRGAPEKQPGQETNEPGTNPLDEFTQDEE